MSKAERYDAVVIGSGEGGKYLAWHLAEAGQKVAVVERRWVGGSCPNINCLPSKNEIWSAGVARIVACCRADYLTSDLSVCFTWSGSRFPGLGALVR